MEEVTLPVIKAKSGLVKKARDKKVDQLVKEVFETEYPDGLKAVRTGFGTPINGSRRAYATP